MDIQILIILAIVFVAAFIYSALGFGLGLIAMPLLALFLDIKTVTPLVALIGVTSIFFVFAGSWKNTDFRNVWKMLLASVFGIPIGLYLLTGAGDTVMKVGLALMIIFFALFSLSGRIGFALRGTRFSFAAGFLSGILGSAYNMGGPPVVIYGTLKHWSPSQFRATLNSFFFPISAIVTCSHFIAGLMTKPVLSYFYYSIPVLVVAVFVGGKVNRTIPIERFQKVIHVLLLMIGFLLLVKTVM